MSSSRPLRATADAVFLIVEFLHAVRIRVDADQYTLIAPCGNGCPAGRPLGMRVEL